MRAINTLRTAFADILKENGFDWPEKTVIEPPRNPKFGDLSINAAILLAKNPHELAQKFAARLLVRCPDIQKAEAAGPGFCNVTFAPAFWQRIVPDIESAGDAYGNCAVGQGRRVLLEYVSANPTGPLHVGHGRGAAVGDSLCRLLRRTGYHVDSEYYINDAGNQMRMLGLSVWLRVLEKTGRDVTWPDEYYRGDYIVDIAQKLLAADPTLADCPEAEGLERCRTYAVKEILDGIREDLCAFRVEHLYWFSEKSLLDHEHHAVNTVLAALTAAGYTYTEENAFWFATEKLGDDKNRVLKKSDGSLTYFATDIAYHHNKFQRGYDSLIDVWGTDHHGYIHRLRAAISAMGQPRDRFHVVQIQLVNLLRDRKPVGMSTRAGTFETLAQVVQEVGVDAARFMFLSRKSDSPLDFDLELVKQRTLDNPVYYVQYAHARICAVLRRAEETGITLPHPVTEALLAPLDTVEDSALLRKADSFENTLRAAATLLSPQYVSYYLMELAGLLHSYYAKHQVLAPDNMPRTLARMALLRAVGQVLRNGLDILGVSAPDTM
ncbi:MAG: arginyl-tRNA synthetase [Candidatus Desulfovibrio kirbyi]|uniref:Arginine--tRNA ligase n=1 Tax=Candidatus Desulfovibrio kirbyi TaxID=2696086 RepID=A0A6L2R683_9BACT|nr:MAG: arginyl-tRNA synthetase [Candidatus Desulfovibrio kirbyi]